MSLLNSLYNLPEGCIWGLINEVDRKVYLRHSSDLLVGLQRDIKDIKLGCHRYKDLIKDWGKLDLIILDKHSCKNTRLVLLGKRYNEYRNKGYSLYNNYTPIKIKVRISIETDGFIYVYYCTQRNSKLVLGVFDKMDEAKAFVSNYLDSDDGMVLPVYSLTPLTYQYYRKRMI